MNIFLVSPDWEAKFLEVSQRRLTRLFSGNFPFLLDCGDL
jgi:hypothetical protein